MIPFEEAEPQRALWARLRILGMRQRASQAQRRHRALLAYTAALGFIQVIIARLLIFGVGLKNMKTVDPMSIPLKWRGPRWEPGLFAFLDHGFVVNGLFVLLVASLAAAVVAWGMSTAPKVDRIRQGSSKLRRRRPSRPL